MSNPYNEALGATLIERTIRERIVIVGVTFPGSDDEDTDASSFGGGKAVATNVFVRTPNGWRLWIHHASPVVSGGHDDHE